MKKTPDRVVAKRRKRNAARQRALRAHRDKHKLCRTCGKKAVKSKRTGLLSRACTRHLGTDAARKTGERIVELPWLSDRSAAKVARARR